MRALEGFRTRVQAHVHLQAALGGEGVAAHMAAEELLAWGMSPESAGQRTRPGLLPPSPTPPALDPCAASTFPTPSTPVAHRTPGHVAENLKVSQGHCLGPEFGVPSFTIQRHTAPCIRVSAPRF